MPVACALKRPRIDMPESREPPPLTQISPVTVEYRGRPLVYFGGSDYFRLAWHPRVRAAVARSARRDGHNVAASRLTTGNHPLHLELERELARFLGFPSAVLVPGGYLAPMVAVQALASQYSHVILDASAHGCLRDAAAISGLPVITFSRTDSGALTRATRSRARGFRPLILTDGLSPFDGSITPLREYLTALPDSALLLVDDAHGAGTLGVRGRGSLEHLGISDPRVLLTVTLSKALGAYGGAVLGPAWLREQVVRESRLYGGSTPLPPPLAAAGLAALELLGSFGPALRAKLRQNTRLVRERLADAGLAVRELPGPVFSFAPVGAECQTRLRRGLLAAGIYPNFIRYASGPADRYFRFAISTAHTKRQLITLADTLAKFLAPGSSGD